MKLLFIVFMLPVMAPMLIEVWLHRIRPEWFVRFSLWTLGTHAFTLDRPKRQEANEGYRQGAARASMPMLKKDLPLMDGGVVAKSGKLVLCPTLGALGEKSKVGWLIAIEASRIHDTITLRARRIPFPISIVLPIATLCLACATSVENLIGCIAVVLLCGLTAAFSIATRPNAQALVMREAFGALEAEYRALLEVPK